MSFCGFCECFSRDSVEDYYVCQFDGRVRCAFDVESLVKVCPLED